MRNAVVELQEHTQKSGIELPEYSYADIDEGHPKQYECSLKVFISDEVFRFTATSKKKAKEGAASIAINALPPLVKMIKTPEKTTTSKPNIKAGGFSSQCDWHSAVMVYAAQSNIKYLVSASVVNGSDVEAVGDFDGEIKSAISNNKQNAKQLVAKHFFDDLGLTYADRLDMSQLAVSLKEAYPNCKTRVRGNEVDVVSTSPLPKEDKEQKESELLETHPEINFSYYVNANLLFPAHSKPHATKETNNFDQNYASIVIHGFTPDSIRVRKISWYVESKAVQVHIEALGKDIRKNTDIENFKNNIVDEFGFLVLINQRKRSQLAIDELKAMAVNGIVTKTDVSRITTGDYYKPVQYPEPVIDLKDRVDHRDQHTFTIDSDSSIDLDDGFAVDLKEDGLCVYVHIADVAALFPENTIEDVKALKQGVTYYGIARQLPMIPEKTMFQASLLPMKDRMAWTVKMDLSLAGEVKDFEIYKSVVRSKFRLNQKQVIQTIDSNADAISKILKAMVQTSEKLKDVRLDQGGLTNFNDENSGYQLVQEFMLLANRCVAEYCIVNKIPVPYRHHAFPNGSEDFRSKYNIGQHDMQDALIPFLGKALYSAEETSHEALGFDAYCHFTSPIRRYADLLLQRQLSIHTNMQTPKNTDEVKTIINQLNISAKEADSQQGKMIYLEVLKKQFDQIGKKIEGVVIEINDTKMIIKPNDSKCSFNIEVEPNAGQELKDTVHVKFVNAFNVVNGRFNGVTA